MVYTFDSNTIELYLKLCLWTMLHHDRGTIKIYILIDNREVEQSARLFSNETIKLTGALTSQKYTDFRLTVYEDFSTNTVIISPPITLSLMH